MKRIVAGAYDPGNGQGSFLLPGFEFFVMIRSMRPLGCANARMAFKVPVARNQ
jgi:hypothetical protein